MLAFLSALVPGLPSLETLKLAAFGVACVVWTALASYGGYRWELSAFDDYKAKAATHELALQQRYDAIGGDEAKRYQAAVTADLAETKRQLQELQNAPASKPTPRQRLMRTKPSPSAPSDADRIVRVLRDAADGHN